MKQRILFFVAAILLAGTVNTQAALQGGKEVPSMPTARNSASGGEDAKPAVTPATTDPAYVIGPQDVLDINVWKEPDMSPRRSGAARRKNFVAADQRRAGCRHDAPAIGRGCNQQAAEILDRTSGHRDRHPNQ